MGKPAFSTMASTCARTTVSMLSPNSSTERARVRNGVTSTGANIWAAMINEYVDADVANSRRPSSADVLSSPIRLPPPACPVTIVAAGRAAPREEEASVSSLTLSPGMVLQAENRAYGHAQTLSEYAGYPRARWVPGALQHGWNPFDGIGIYDGTWRPLPKFVWSEENVRRGIKHGGRGYRAIGAPWLYLLRMQATSPPPGGRNRVDDRDPVPRDGAHPDDRQPCRVRA